MQVTIVDYYDREGILRRAFGTIEKEAGNHFLLVHHYAVDKQNDFKGKSTYVYKDQVDWQLTINIDVNQQGKVTNISHKQLITGEKQNVKIK